MYFVIKSKDKVYHGYYRGSVKIEEMTLMLYNRYLRYNNPMCRVWYKDWMDIIIEEDHTIEEISEDEYKPDLNPPIKNDYTDEYNKHRAHSEKYHKSILNARYKYITEHPYMCPCSHFNTKSHEKSLFHEEWIQSERHVKINLDEKVKCGCGGNHKLRYKKQHEMSKRHQEWKVKDENREI